MDDHSGHAHGEHDHGEHTHVSYEEAVEAYRRDKDSFFGSSPDSPVPPAERTGFGGIPYFEVDRSMRFDGLTLEPYAGSEPTSFQIPTTDGQLRPAARAGTFRFTVAGVPASLTAYTFEGDDSGQLFVPFLDGTTGRETYGAGRYLDLEPDLDGTYTLDFNLAYHPSCVFDPRFSCPLTPPENRLAVRVEAGERLPVEELPVQERPAG
jgi:uncharacterized protein (DUF1684 family)